MLFLLLLFLFKPTSSPFIHSWTILCGVCGIGTKKAQTSFAQRRTLHQAQRRAGAHPPTHPLRDDASRPGQGKPQFHGDGASLLRIKSEWGWRRGISLQRKHSKAQRDEKTSDGSIIITHLSWLGWHFVSLFSSKREKKSSLEKRMYCSVLLFDVGVQAQSLIGMDGLLWLSCFLFFYFSIFLFVLFPYEGSIVCQFWRSSRSKWAEKTSQIKGGFLF